MLSKSEIEACETMALDVYERCGFAPDRPVAPGLLCEVLFGTRPRICAGLPREGLMSMVDGAPWIYVRPSGHAARTRFVTAHEIAHPVIGRRHDDDDVHLEMRCDMLAMCLLAPRPAFELALRHCGHSVYDLAHALSITQAAAMLRLGEVTGRPVRLLGARERIRGEPFDWPDARACLRGLHRGRVHPVRLADEGKWGLMAG